MPRALVVTHQWLPMFSAGVKHVANLCRYLPSAGWEPHILTRDWSDGPAPHDANPELRTQPIDAPASLKHAASFPVVYAPDPPRDNRWLRRQARLEAERTAHRAFTLAAIERTVLRATYSLYGHYPDMHRGWVEPAVAAGLSAVRQYGIGAVVSFCPPASAHFVGSEIARRAGIPWVAVFAELSAFYHGDGDERTRGQRWMDRSLARRCLSVASRSATISPAMLKYVRDTYGVTGDIVVAPFDPAERRVAPHRASRSPLRLVHVGTVHPSRQKPELLFDALDRLVDAGHVGPGLMTVDLVGSGCETSLAEMLRERPCASMIRFVDRVSPAEAIRIQREADVLLLFNYNGSAETDGSATMSYPRKVFEHLNAARPTIAVGPDAEGFIGKLLTSTQAGQTAEDAESLSVVILDYLTELRSAGQIAFRGDESVITRYGAPEQARRLAALLDAASAERFGSWQRA